MAKGFKKGVNYNWRIEINQDEMFAEFRDTARKAFKVFKELNELCPGSKLYCDGKLVSE